MTVNTSSGTTTHEQIKQVQSKLQQQLVGHEALIERLLIALLTGGHVLIEGAPGLAKTRTINQFAKLIDARFVRIQATPDLLPADLTGTEMYHQQSGEFRFIEGPLFNNIVLMDEINRAPPKVQSALLEAMGERQISSGGKTRTLESPFLVAATQNPIEHEGTYPLPEAQLDRFMFFINVEMPDTHAERQILDQVLSERYSKTSEREQSAVCSTETIDQAATQVSVVHVSDAIKDYIVRLVGATRGEGSAGDIAEHITHPASPRGSIFLACAAQARAWLEGRDYIAPEDIDELAIDTLSGRIVPHYQARAQGITRRDLIRQILESTPAL
jgi:MoxR-like ATPase